ncbi:DUF6906 family protein [Halalkalibacter hemicellulosilyticus]|nr:hypothetical protein [Halalkalibacter hemicellulosilyticus]
MEHKIPIPHDYKWMTEGYENRAALFKKYVLGYLAKSHPELTLIRIEGMTAICERKEGFKVMKQGKRPTKRQKLLMEQNGLNHSEWLVVKSLRTEIHLVHREKEDQLVIHL